MLRPTIRLLALVLLAAPAAAQLDLPDVPPRPARASDGEAGSGAQDGAPEIGLVPPRPRRTRGGLDLPAAVPAARERAPEEAPDAAPAPPPERLAPAEFVFEELARVRDPASSLIARASESLVALGPDGLDAARAHLGQARPASVLAAIRALLLSGAPADLARVHERLDARMPSRVAVAALQALVELAPGEARPSRLVALLDHPQGSMREAADRLLEKRASPELVELLAPALASERDDTRLRALELATSIGGERALEIAFDRLGDDAARVASFAAGAIAAEADPAILERLEAIAFDGGSLDRRAGYAVLAIADHEDRAGVAVLGAEHEEPLLRALGSPERFPSAVAAIALAGIGFRSERAGSIGWLERDVPDRLVRVLSGAEFHLDYGSVREPARRRLTQIAGVGFGADGPAWVSWWIEAASRFRPRRAILPVGPTDHLLLELEWRAEEGPFALLGPGVTAERRRTLVATSGIARAAWLGADEALELTEILRAAGAFGLERLPAPGDPSAEKGSYFQVRFADRGKRFELGGAPGSDPWYAAARERALELFEHARWQLYPDRAHRDDPRGWWESQRAWWSEPRGELERARRLKRDVLAWLDGAHSARRPDAIDALARLFATEGVAEPSDFPHLVALLAEEPHYGEIARSLVGLALRAGAAGAGKGGGEPRISVELGAELAGAIVEELGPEAEPDLARVVVATELGLARELAREPRAWVRGVAARALASSGDERDRFLLERLLDDPDPSVGAATARALGELGADAFRAHLIERARRAPAELRVASIDGLAALGGEGALDTLVVALHDPVGEVRRAAARGIAELGDPEGAAPLVRVLSSSADPELLAAARRGLASFGEDAHEALLNALYAGREQGQREAALLLSDQCVPAVASTLIRLLHERPEDDEIAFELAVLSGRDFRGHPDRTDRWWAWWDEASRADGLGWFTSSLAERGVVSPPAAAFAGGGTRRAALFLLEIAERPEEHLAERARRELELLLGSEVDAAPAEPVRRDAWRGELWSRVGARYPD